MFVFYLQPIDLTGGGQLVTAMMGMIFLLFFFTFSFFASDDEAGKCARHVVGDVENLAGEIRMLDTCPVSGPIFKFRFTGRALPNLLSC